MSLVDHEEIGELDISDLVSNNTSVFAKLLSNEESMKVMLLIVYYSMGGEQSTL